MARLISLRNFVTILVVSYERFAGFFDGPSTNCLHIIFIRGYPWMYAQDRDAGSDFLACRGFEGLQTTPLIYAG
jgi:hypothetical protein